MRAIRLLLRLKVERPIVDLMIPSPISPTDQVTHDCQSPYQERNFGISFDRISHWSTVAVLQMASMKGFLVRWEAVAHQDEVVDPHDMARMNAVPPVKELGSSTVELFVCLADE